MKYLIEQKVLSFLKNKYVIKDENKEKLYRVSSNLTVPYKLEMFDNDEKKVLKIKRRYFRIYPRYDIYIDKELVMSMKMKLSFFIKRFKTISSNKDLDDLKITGNMVNYNFSIKKGEDIKAIISKKYISLNDKYSIEILDEENKDIYLAIVITIDNILHKGR